MSIVTDLADAVAAELNRNEAWSIPFRAKRVVVPGKDLKDLNKVFVAVVPAGIRSTAATRARTKLEIEIDIGVQKHLGTDELTEVAVLGTLVDEIVFYLHERILTDQPYAQWRETANEPVYSPEHIAQKRVFTSVISLKYTLLR